MRDPLQTTTKRGEILRRAAGRFPNLDAAAIETHATLESTAGIVNEITFAPLENHGISRGRFNVMMYLSMEELMGNETPSPSDIADSLGVTRATVTQLLDGLERDGLAERRNVGHDRRAQAIHLTDAGRRLFDELIPPISRNIARIFAPLTAAERQTLTKLLAKLTSKNPCL